MSGQSYGDSGPEGRVIGTPVVDLAAGGVLLEKFFGDAGFTVTGFGVVVTSATITGANIITLKRRITLGVATGDVHLVEFTIPTGATIGSVHSAYVKPYGETGLNLADLMEIPPGQSLAVESDGGSSGTSTGQGFVTGYTWPSGSKKVSTAGEDITSPSLLKRYNYSVIAATT